MDEEDKKKILERRETHKRLSEIILAGTEYSEPLTVKTVDGKEYEVTVYALSDQQYRKALEETGVQPQDLMDRNRLLEHMKLAQIVAAMATKDPGICSVIKPVESFKILEKVLKISDIPFRPPPDLREKQIQPTA